jgi:hypothetical protein
LTQSLVDGGHLFFGATGYLCFTNLRKNPNLGRSLIAAGTAAENIRDSWFLTRGKISPARR